MRGLCNSSPVQSDVLDRWFDTMNGPLSFSIADIGAETLAFDQQRLQNLIKRLTEVMGRLVDNDEARAFAIEHGIDLSDPLLAKSDKFKSYQGPTTLAVREAQQHPSILTRSRGPNVVVADGPAGCSSTSHAGPSDAPLHPVGGEANEGTDDERDDDPRDKVDATPESEHLTTAEVAYAVRLFALLEAGLNANPKLGGRCVSCARSVFAFPFFWFFISFFIIQIAPRCLFPFCHCRTGTSRGL